MRLRAMVMFTFLKMLEKLQQFSALTPKPKVLTQSLREVPATLTHSLELRVPTAPWRSSPPFCVAFSI